MTLRWRRHIDRLGVQGLIEVYWEPLDEQVYGPDSKPTIAEVSYTVVAQLLAEPLRRAFVQHLDDHGCAERHGFAYCDKAMRLFDLLPHAEKVIFG
jgi:hypothetical protein